MLLPSQTPVVFDVKHLNFLRPELIYFSKELWIFRKLVIRDHSLGESTAGVQLGGGSDAVGG